MAFRTRGRVETFKVRVTEDQADELRCAHINAAMVAKLKRENPPLYYKMARELNYSE